MNGPDRDCAHVERLFERLLDGRLPEAERRACAAHLASCPRCADLADMAGLFGADMPEVTPAALAPAVLARTTGDACGAVGERLCDRVDGVLRGMDAALVDGHLAHCPGCAQRARSLARLAAVLPTLAEVQPDARFVRDVLAATVRAQPVRAGAGGIEAFWNRLVLRPLFGLQAAYVGALVLLALFGLPFSPLRDVPTEAFDAYRRSTEVVAAGANGVGVVPQRVASAGGLAWESTGALGVLRLAEFRHDLTVRYEATGPARHALRDDGGRLRSAATALDLDKGREAVNSMTENLETLVRALAEPERTESRQQDGGHDR